MENVFTLKKIITFISIFIIVVIVYGAIPFYSIPTFLQAVWATGFSESFVNAGWPAIKAINFGYPASAPISIGLPSVFLQSTLTFLFNFHSADAYALSAVFWLGIALFGGIKFCQMLGANFVEGAYLSLTYLTLPLVWRHADYSMLSLGFALLPLYVHVAFKVVIELPKHKVATKKWCQTAIIYICISLISVFMDGYNFLMFALASGVIGLWGLVKLTDSRKILLTQSAPLMGLSLGIAYFSYTAYFNPPIPLAAFSMDFFRAWGVDIIMLIIPSKGVSWLWDTLGLSILRNETMFFGDYSVWSTTYGLPLILTGITGFIISKRNRFALPLMLIALAGFYFSLGPSLKINSTRPVGVDGQYLAAGQLMPEEIAVAPTGSAIIYERIPGFKYFRATYRWTGLMYTGLFGLTILFYRNLKEKNYEYLAFGIIFFMIISNFPHLYVHLQKAHHYRNSMFIMDKDFAPLAEYVGQDAVVFFAPPGNDFMVNYLASVGNYHAYNTGGDKNIEIARYYWPDSIKSFTQDKITDCFAYQIENVLKQRDADFVVLPYFDLFLGEWPILPAAIQSYRQQLMPTIDHFIDLDQFNVNENDFYSSIFLKPNADLSVILPDLIPGIPEAISGNCQIRLLFAESNGWYNGWNNPDSAGIWSSETGSLEIALPDVCHIGDSECGLEIQFNVFNATPANPKLVKIKLNEQVVANWQINSPDLQEWIIPLPVEFLANSGGQNFVFDIPEAESPLSIGQSVDKRILGILIRELELIYPNDQ